MNVLILGGTRFLGVHLARRLLINRHDVTLLHRGRSLPEGIDGTTSIIGDRDESLERAGSRYDAIVDTSGYLAASVTKSVQYFRHAAPSAIYAFVSSISAYRDGLPPDSDESAPRWDGGDRNAAEVTPETYGPLKARCEDCVTDAYGGSALIVRPGLIVGPLDATDRFTYWVRRMSRGGDVLAPGQAQRHIQFVDVRDLADWIVTALETHVSGTFNATGPQAPLTFEAFLHACAGVTTVPSTLHWVSDDRLLHAGIVPWCGLPLWIPENESDGWDSISSARARAAGFTNRPVEQTIFDTLEWDRGRGYPALSCGLSPDVEERILAER